jgi:adenylate kinase family enzyme
MRVKKTIQIKVNDKPDLPICKMICDTELHDKLNKYELTKFLNNHSTNLICGLPGSGKTNLMYQLMKSKHLLNKVYDKIYLFQPPESRVSMKDKLFDQLPDEQKFSELTFENLSTVNDALNDEENSCIIFDDMGSHLKDTEIKKLLKEMIMNRRHKHLSIFFLVQTYFSIEKDMRRLFSNLFIFRVNKSTMENIFEEVVEEHKKSVEDIIKIVYNKPYQYLFINVTSQRLFKGFDELLFD